MIAVERAYESFEWLQGTARMLQWTECPGTMNDMRSTLEKKIPR